jgi:hypothetical protein
LDGGSALSGLNDDVPTVTAMVAVDVVKVGGTYEILERWISLINAGRVLIPFLLVRGYQ